MVEGTINNYRIGRKTKSSNQMIVVVSGSTTKDGAAKYVGKNVEYTTEAGRKINGKVAAAHGTKGSVRVIFEKGMPGQAIGRKVNIQ